MSDAPQNDEQPPIDWHGIPNHPQLRALIASGWGEMEIHDDGVGPITGFHSLSFDDMVAMGEAERIRLGVQKTYLFALEYGAGQT